MTTLQYCSMAYKHLGDTSTYLPLSHDPTLDVVDGLTGYTLHLKNCSVINDATANFLLPPVRTRTQRIYFLSKLHKNPVSLRPIVSGCNGPTEAVYNAGLIWLVVYSYYSRIYINISSKRAKKEKHKLRNKGFRKAYQVLGKFLLLDKNEEEFKAWQCVTMFWCSTPTARQKKVSWESYGFHITAPEEGISVQASTRCSPTLSCPHKVSKVLPYKFQRDAVSSLYNIMYNRNSFSGTS